MTDNDATQTRQDDATKQLRAMLDERGVEWWPMHEIENGYYDDRDTEFVIDGKKYTAHEWGAKLTVYGVTPAQAIAATLGTGMCRNAAPNYLDFLCSECWFVHYHSDENDSGDGNEWNYCPNCGRRIEVTA